MCELVYDPADDPYRPIYLDIKEQCTCNVFLPDNILEGVQHLRNGQYEAFTASGSLGIFDDVGEALRVYCAAEDVPGD